MVRPRIVSAAVLMLVTPAVLGPVDDQYADTVYSDGFDAGGANTPTHSTT
jgi:hypothetical protein